MEMLGDKVPSSTPTSLSRQRNRRRVRETRHAMCSGKEKEHFIAPSAKNNIRNAQVSSGRRKKECHSSVRKRREIMQGSRKKNTKRGGAMKGKGENINTRF